MTDADGYFSPRDHPQEMVVDPSLPQKVLEEEEAAVLAAATVASLNGGSAGQPGENGRGVASAVEGEGAAGMTDSPPRYTFAPEEEEMVADGFRRGMGMGGYGMGVGSMGIGGVDMGGMMGMGMGMGMGIGIGIGHVPMGVVLPESQVSPVQPQLQLPPHLLEIPQPSPPLSVPSLPLMQPLQTPQSMSDRPPVTEEHSEEEEFPDCDDVEGHCSCHQRGRRSRHHCRHSVVGGGCCGRATRSEREHRARSRIIGVVWGVILLVVVCGAWNMYHRFIHRGPPGPLWVMGPEDNFQCHHAPFSYMGQNIFRFPIDGGNASNAAPSFYLHQRPLDPSHPWRRGHGTRFAGEVVVAGHTPAEDEGMVKVEFDISMSREWMKQAIKLEKGKDGNGATIYTDYKAPKWEDWRHPEHPRGPPGPPPCATIRVLVSIPRGITGKTRNAATAVLRKFDIDVQSLCITIDHASLDLAVEGDTTLQSFCGDITLAGTRDDGPPPSLGARGQFPWVFPGPPPPHLKHSAGKLDMQTVSNGSTGFRTKSLKAKTLTGRIHAVPMRRAPGTIEAENAELETTSGPIRVAVVPQPAPSKHFGPANITIRTVSGDVLLDRPLAMDETVALDKLRSTSTYIWTTTGRIVGETLITNGSLLDAKSFSGDIDLFHVSVPDGTPSNPPFLKTETESGSTRVKVLPLGAQCEYPPHPSDDGEVMVNKLKNQALQSKFVVQGKHTSVSGRIEAVYYPTWEGGFIGRSLSGEVRSAGAGVLLVLPNDKSYEPKHWSEISSGNDGIPTPDPTIWKIVRARKGQKGSGGMVEIQSVTGDVEFFVGERRGWWELLEAAKEKGREWLKKVGCVWWKGKKGQMVEVGVQTEEEDRKTDEVSQEWNKTSVDKQAKGKTLVETEEGMGLPSEIEPGTDSKEEVGAEKEVEDKSTITRRLLQTSL